MDIGAWLSSLGLEEYEGAFASHAVDAEVLPELTDSDLKEIGVIALGHRRKILVAIKQLQLTGTGTEVAALPVQHETRIQSEEYGERRHVAVLFADLVGYTQLTEELGAEAMHDLLNVYFAWLDGIIEACGGRVDKHIGDCVMGVFGAPVSHGNDAERAVRAAIRIAKTLPELRERVGRDIQVHTGVSIGVVVASYVGSGRTAEYAVMGESVNLASRLSDAAAPGEILISDGLHQALSDRLESKPVGELTVKGFAAPIRAWRLIDLVERQSEPDRLAGRSNEIRQFEAILQACKADQRGHAIILRGEAGLGKTRLSEEFERIAGEKDFSAHRGLVLDFGDETGRDAFRVIMRGLLGVSGHASPQDLEAAVRHAVEEGAVPADLQVYLNVLVDAPQSDELKTLYNAMDDEQRSVGRAKTMGQLLSWATRRTPRLLIIEDLHWARAAQLRAFAQLTRAVGQNAAILVFTTRPDGDPLDRLWKSSVGETAFTTFDLSPLSEQDAKAICEAFLDSEGISENLIKRAGGNPLFLKQLLLYQGEDCGGEAVPGTIQSLVQATIDQLSQEDKVLIQSASVVGQRVDPAILEALSGRASPNFDVLIEKNLLRPQGRELLFVHALIRDAVYESLLTQTRRKLHLRAAEWFAGQDLRLHAEHLKLAGSPEAPKAFLAAAREAGEAFNYETAIALIQSGLSLNPNPEESFALYLLAGGIWHDFGRMDEAGDALRHALALAATPLDRCHVLVGLAGVKRVTEDVDGALKDLENAAAAIEGEDVPVEWSQINFLKGNLLFPRGDMDGCLQAHSMALKLAREAKRKDLQAAALGGLGDAEYVRGRMASARHRLEECVALAHEERLERTVVANEAQIAQTFIYTGSQQEARDMACRAIESAQRIGHLRAEVNARAALVKTQSAMALYNECLNEIEPYTALIDQLGTLRFRQEAYMLSARSLAGLGRRAEALKLLEEGLIFAHRTGFSFYGPAMASCFALLTRDAGRRRALLEEAEQGISDGCVGHNQFRVYADGIDVAFEMEDAKMLSHYTSRIEGYPGGEELEWSSFQAARGRALLEVLQEGKTAETLAALKGVQDQVQRLQMWDWSVEHLLS